jgi:uncharacterized protein (DUF486 family)
MRKLAQVFRLEKICGPEELAVGTARRGTQTEAGWCYSKAIGSNVFMTTAWYWHLRYKDVPIVYVIFISWSLAFVEYCLAVPANRYGNAVYNAAQLKTIQEVITFVVFAGFSYLYLQEPITLSQGFGFALIATGAFFVFHTW